MYTRNLFESCLCEVEFSDDGVTILTDNAVAKVMYSQCNVDGSKDLILEEHIDAVCKDDVIALDQQ